VESTETPAERIAGDLALAAAQGVRVPAPGRLAAVYDVPPATVTAAAGRLKAGDGAEELLAAAAMCRRLPGLAGSQAIGPVDVGARWLTGVGDAARWLAEQFLGRRPPPVRGRRQRLQRGRARQVIHLGRRAAAARGSAVEFPWTRDLAAASFPEPVSAALTRPGLGARVPASHPRPAPAAAPRPSL
jgi:hypothetical protein